LNELGSSLAFVRRPRRFKNNLAAAQHGFSPLSTAVLRGLRDALLGRRRASFGQDFRIFAFGAGSGVELLL